jgi:hypothetical protein
MFEHSVQDLMRRYSQEDALAAGIRVALSTLGPVGAIGAEFLTQFVPRQRADRLQDFIEQMAHRFRDVEEQQLRDRLETSAAFSSLAEQASLAAARSASSKRRRELADLLRTGFSRPDAELIEHEALLHLLERLNDAQVLILMDHGHFEPTFGNTKRQTFQAKHAGVFDVMPPDSGASEGQARRWVMYRHYEDDLVSLGLLRDLEGVAKSGRRRKVAIADLGRLLLDAINKNEEQ